MIATPTLDTTAANALPARTEDPPRALPSESGPLCSGIWPSPPAASFTDEDSQILAVFLDPTVPLAAVAPRAGITFKQFFEWLARPGSRERIAMIKEVAKERAELLALESTADSIDALRAAARVHLHTLNTSDPVKIARLAETSRKAANQLLRIAGIPARVERRSAASPPTRPRRAPAPQAKGLTVSSRGLSDESARSDTPGIPPENIRTPKGSSSDNADTGGTHSLLNPSRPAPDQQNPDCKGGGRDAHPLTTAHPHPQDGT